MAANKNKPGDSNVIHLPSYTKAQPIPGLIFEQAAPTQNPQLDAALRRSRAAGEETALLVLRIGEYRVLSETFGEDFGSQLSAMVEDRFF